MANFVIPKTKSSTVAMAFLGVLVIIGGLTVGRRGARWMAARMDDTVIEFRGPVPQLQRIKVPISKRPGPPRNEPIEFRLNDENSVRMQGIQGPQQERWADIAGNFYSGTFCQNFRYDDSSATGPLVRLQWAKEGETFKGRLEARRLKPNFAYQIKLIGDYVRAPKAYEIIGYHGRWRLPGRGTNYTDNDYRNHPNKKEVRAYLLFDFFVTNEHGDAVREFALDSTLHVLWNASWQRGCPKEDQIPVTVRADNPKLYSVPKKEPQPQRIWAERETVRYRNRDPGMPFRLPAGDYEAFVALTEESFHASELDGGYWATVFGVPVSFKITPPTVASPTPPPATSNHTSNATTSPPD